METGELFATKGIEYVLVITYLALLVSGFKLVFPKAKGPREKHEHHGPLPAGYFFHQGHAWAHPVDAWKLRVGLDDFAQKAIGHPFELTLPARGTVLNEGEPAWEVQHDHGKHFAMLSPVSGIVVAVNDDVVHSPGLVNTQPYTEGWLLEVQVSSDAYRRNLLSGELAEHWMRRTYELPAEETGAALMAVDRHAEPANH
jgi:glycine cleavage system H lipoate-binding protein